MESLVTLVEAYEATPHPIDLPDPNDTTVRPSATQHRGGSLRPRLARDPDM